MGSLENNLDEDIEALKNNSQDEKVLHNDVTNTRLNNWVVKLNNLINLHTLSKKKKLQGLSQII